MNVRWNYLMGMILSLIPVVIAIYYASAYSFGWFDVQDQEFSLKHWSALLQDPALGSSIWFSFKNSFLSLLLTLLFAFWIADHEYRTKKERLPLYFFLPLAIPPIVAAFLGFQWLNGGGWLSRISFKLGLTDSLQEFPDLIYTASGIGIILVHALLLLPFFTILTHNYYRQSNIFLLEELSRNLGVSKVYFFIKVKLPLILKKLFPMSLLYLILLMGSYEVPLVIGGQHPKMLSVFVVEKLQRFDLANMPQAYAVALLFFIFVSVAVIFIHHLIPKRFIQRI